MTAVAVDRLPPETAAEREEAGMLEAERAVLCNMMLDAGAIAIAAAHLSAGDFQRVAHRRIFEAINRLAAVPERVDLVTLAEELRSEGHLKTSGDSLYLSQLFDSRGTAANTEAYARIVRRYAARRQARDAVRRLPTALEDPTADFATAVDATIEQLTRARETASPHNGVEVLLAQVETDQQLLEADVPDVESVVGEGLLVRGGVNLIVGHSGLGKTFLAMQLERDVAYTGNFLGYPTMRGRAGMLQLEMPRASMRKRIGHALAGISGRGAIDFLTLPRDLPPITDPRAKDRLALWADRSKLLVMVIDPAHGISGEMDENRNPDVGRGLAALLWIARRTGVCIVVLHHVNKLVLDDRVPVRTAVLLSVRGAGRWVNDTDTVLGLAEGRGRVRLIFGKTRHGASPEEIDLLRGPTGFFEVTDTPQQVYDRTDEKILKALGFLGEKGGTLDDLTKLTELGRATVYRHIRRLGVIEMKDGRTKRFYGPGQEPPQEELLGAT